MIALGVTHAAGEQHAQKSYALQDAVCVHIISFPLTPEPLYGPDSDSEYIAFFAPGSS
jgi:hypothetical protein